MTSEDGSGSGSSGSTEGEEKLDDEVELLPRPFGGYTLLAVLVGALFAVLSYSSLAAVLLTSTLAGAGLISLPVALGLVIGLPALVLYSASLAVFAVVIAGLRLVRR